MGSIQERRDGGCLCGAVRYRAAGAPLWVAHCHCGSCRRAAGAPFVTWAGFAAAAFAMIRGAPRDYASSPGVTRRFCGACGTSLTYEGGRWPGEVHVLAATLDDPHSVTPQAHAFAGERLAWIRTADGLPDVAAVAGDA